MTDAQKACEWIGKTVFYVENEKVQELKVNGISKAEGKAYYVKLDDRTWGWDIDWLPITTKVYATPEEAEGGRGE